MVIRQFQSGPPVELASPPAASQRVPPFGRGPRTHTDGHLLRFANGRFAVRHLDHGHRPELSIVRSEIGR